MGRVARRSQWCHLHSLRDLRAEPRRESVAAGDIQLQRPDRRADGACAAPAHTCQKLKGSSDIARAHELSDALLCPLHLLHCAASVQMATEFSWCRLPG